MVLGGQLELGDIPPYQTLYHEIVQHRILTFGTNASARNIVVASNTTIFARAVSVLRSPFSVNFDRMITMTHKLDE